MIARWSVAPGFTLVTQNVDGLHERAGTREVVRYRGSIWRLRCAAEDHGEWEDLRVPLDSAPAALRVVRRAGAARGRVVR